MRTLYHAWKELARRRITSLPYGYSPAVVVVTAALVFVVVLVAVEQRNALIPPGLPILAGVIALVPSLLFAAFGLPPRPISLALTMIGGTALLLWSAPVESDLAPFILVILVGEVAAISRVAPTILVAFACGVTLEVADTTGHLYGALPQYITALVLGCFAGFIVQLQQRLQENEQALQEQKIEQAASEERQRVAREVHDVIAQSLSLTMMKLAGVRQALMQDRDIDGAVDAMTDTERLGRQSMSDIRRTIRLLEVEPMTVIPEPDVIDIGELVAEFVRGGIQVKYAVQGDWRSVSAVTGLALYRITQESLANIAKHAPSSTAMIDLRITDSTATLVVVNDAPQCLTSRARGGAGLRSMRQRAELLGGRLQVGPGDDGWLVRAELPKGTDPGDMLRPFQGMT
ncbi:sensor histidine kinase [Nocardia sp. NPDC006044]|uniref:sensor histidine kinase n=1 Tax=Nocardia sp. NPDC006044 TaxID=3364306 RepID=UPI00368A54FE